MSKTIALIDPAELKRRVSELYGPENAKTQTERWAKLVEQLGATAAAKSAKDGDLLLVSAPGRTEIGGNHTDHNQGRVVAASIDLDSIAAALKTDNNIVEIKSEGFKAFKVDLSNLDIVENEKASSAALVRGIAAKLAKDGRKIGGFTATISSQVPAGSGLSSSASFEILIGSIFNHAYNKGKIGTVELAIAGQFSENNYFGKPCGLMDQIACASGGVVGIDFADAEKPVLSRVEADPLEFGYALVMVDTGGSHADLTEEYAAVPGEMKAVAAFFKKKVLREITEAELNAKIPELRKKFGDRAVLRSMHFLGDTKRAAAQLTALKSRDFEGFLKMVRESGYSSATKLQNLHPASLPKEQGMDLALAITSDFLGDAGAFRVHGGGFGGSIQVYVPKAKLAKYKTLMQSVFGEDSVRVLRIRAKGATSL